MDKLNGLKVDVGLKSTQTKQMSTQSAAVCVQRRPGSRRVAAQPGRKLTSVGRGLHLASKVHISGQALQDGFKYVQFGEVSWKENFATWKFSMKTYLEHEDLWCCVECPKDKPVDASKDVKAKSKLILLLDPQNYVHVQECKTAKQVWDSLQRAFDDNGLTRRVGLLKDLINTTLESSNSVEDYVTANLLSVSTIVKNGHKVTFSTKGCEVRNGKDEVICTATLNNNLYIMDTSTEVAHLTSSTQSCDTYLWHLRMGHLNFHDVKKLPDVTEGVTLTQQQSNIACTHCMEGRQARMPFKSVGSRAERPLELIHSDLCRPMENSSFGDLYPIHPQQNGMAERMNRTLVERARCMLFYANLEK
ncbi:Retrovirus-related Pol polyprotein from transposon TNT 1-94 [Eumeta japonica]|uniref:Retrovirus-related Pol polyprotein from transposon TNT 1-94 n=1 Tax=Eumeta variegata TaxID=151549 RepID=A0A4C2A8K6_EUMVA|nr:Retrovirus-related Pol polyprotein from transposon TNT 1-94 [Eumeta japonica]